MSTGGKVLNSTWRKRNTADAEKGLQSKKVNERNSTKVGNILLDVIILIIITCIDAIRWANIS